MIGQWILQGPIAGRETTHDIVTEWVLGHQYVQLQEISREKNTSGEAMYEATVFILVLYSVLLFQAMKRQVNYYSF